MERELTILGEAVKRLSQSFRAAHPEIPWPGFVGLRNVLTHEYDEIDNHKIFILATELAPKLATQLRSILPSIPPDPEPEP